jgi:hypothetical protein
MGMRYGYGAWSMGIEYRVWECSMGMEYGYEVWVWSMGMNRYRYGIWSVGMGGVWSIGMEYRLWSMGIGIGMEFWKHGYRYTWNMEYG